MSIQKTLTNPCDPGTPYGTGIITINSIKMDDQAKIVTVNYVCYANATAKTNNVPFSAGDITLTNVLSKLDENQVETPLNGPFWGDWANVKAKNLPGITTESTVLDIIKTAAYVVGKQFARLAGGVDV